MIGRRGLFRDSADPGRALQPFGISSPNRSSTRPTVWSIKSSIVLGWV